MARKLGEGLTRRFQRIASNDATDSFIDELILRFTRPRQLKVARVLGDVFVECKAKGFEVSEERLEARLRALIDSKQIESFGDVSKWRFSEIRLAQGVD